MERHPRQPVVLALAGHDPSGGAGIQADIEAIQAQGCLAATALTCLTVQDSTQVHACLPVAPDLFLRQARCVIGDLGPAVIKIGLVPSAALAGAIDDLLREHPEIPVVLDPILHAGGGQRLSAAEWLRPLLPRCTLITPNRHEARQLAKREDPERCARALLALGAGAVLVTGADEAGKDQVTHSLHVESGARHWQWPRLPHQYHGSGCTLASAIAARLALGTPLEAAVEQGQAYTWNSLEKATRPGHGQLFPARRAC